MAIYSDLHFNICFKILSPSTASMQAFIKIKYNPLPQQASILFIIPREQTKRPFSVGRVCEASMEN